MDAIINPPPQPIIFYDGECGLCRRWVQRILSRDYHHRFRFAPLQGDTARRYLVESMGTDAHAILALQTVVYLTTTGERYLRSDAVLRIANDLGRGWRLLVWLQIIPRFLRDGAYNLVVRRRKRLSPQPPGCPLTAADNDVFLP